jgi:single-strand DNA-binding protein
MIDLIMTGNLGKDCVVRDHNGKKYASFSIADTRSWEDESGVKHERTTWVNCTLWKSDKVYPYLKKGAKILVTGYPQSNAWVSKDSGELNSCIELTVTKLELLHVPTTAAEPA